MGNASCHPSLRTNPRSTPNIFTSTYHNQLSDYMDRDGWIKAITQFLNVCGDSHVNNQIRFCDSHVSHFDYFTLIKMIYRKIQPFVLKASNYINYQPNDNVPNAKLKSLYNVENNEWMMKYGTAKFFTSPHKILIG